MDEVNAKKELPACPVETTLTLIGDKWKVLILRDLMPGTRRFGELKKSVGNVSQKVLTAQLRAMEENGLVHREVYAEVPPRAEYSLTELGKSLKPILDSMWAWGEGYKSLMSEKKITTAPSKRADHSIAGRCSYLIGQFLLRFESGKSSARLHGRLLCR